MEKNYEYKKDIKRVRWLCFAVILSLFVAEALFQAIMSFMTSKPHDYIRMAIVEIAAFCIPFAAFGNPAARKINKKEDLRLNTFSFSKFIFVVLLGITGQFVMMLINLPLEYLFINSEEVRVSAKTVTNVPLVLFGGVISVGIIPAFFEELWMRGFVFGAYNKINTKTATIFTTVMFALFHAKPEEVPGYLFMGAMTVFVMLRCNSLYAAMIYHFVSNITALIFSYLVMKIVPFLWPLFAVMILLFTVVFLIFYGRYKRVDVVGERVNTRLLWGSFLSLPVLFSICILILKYCLLNL